VLAVLSTSGEAEEVPRDRAGWRQSQVACVVSIPLGETGQVKLVDLG